MPGCPPPTMTGGGLAGWMECKSLSCNDFHTRKSTYQATLADSSPSLYPNIVAMTDIETGCAKGALGHGMCFNECARSAFRLSAPVSSGIPFGDEDRALLTCLCPR